MIRLVQCSLFGCRAPSGRVQNTVRNTVPANGHHFDSIELEFDLCSRPLILFRSEVISHDHMRHHRCTGRREQSERTQSSTVSRRYEKKSKDFPESLSVHVLFLSGWSLSHQMRIYTMLGSAIEHFYSSIRLCRFMTHFASIM